MLRSLGSVGVVRAFPSNGSHLVRAADKKLSVSTEVTLIACGHPTSR